jgi:asparagine synthase (glutamine-hydrolysing)
MPRLSAARLAKAVGEIGREFDLDPATAWEIGSAGGGASAAGVHHGSVAAPRRYLARDGLTVTLFDGLPVDPSGRHAAHDAAEIARGWNDWVGDLEGQFCAARIDLERERVELLLDTFGLMPVFVARREGGVLASNSVGVIRSLLELNAPDPLGVSSMVGLGWAASRHTLLRDVMALCGGARHEIRDGRVVTHTHFGPQHIAPRSKVRLSARGNVAELADYMATLTQSAARGIEPVRCAVTAGRDSRLVLALVRARDIAAECYTIGPPDDPDVIWGRELARRSHLSHEVLVPQADAGHDWTRLASRLIAQTDGLSDFRQLIDYLHPEGSRGLGVRMSGLGGEIGRNGPYDNTITAANVPLLGHLAGLQRRVLRMKADAFRGLMTPAAQAVLDRNTDRFFDERLAEGWHANEIADLFFAFERVGCHGATAPRRAAAVDDLFSPYCTRRYTEYCLTMSPADRYVELPYHQLLGRLSPELAAIPFEEPLPAPRPRRAGLRAIRRVAIVGADRAGIAGRARRAAGADESPFLAEWLEQRLDLMGDLFAHDGSPLWDFVSRDAVHALMQAGPRERGTRLVGLLRVATAFWYFHGPAPS